ncbi:MAG: hypothetical protein GX601_05520 [Anaerolineales bacterium]|nr:hypothetical protein [Anaerolineales bacterium]
MPESSSVWWEGAVWLTGSFLMAVVWTNVAWYLRQPRSAAVGQDDDRLATWAGDPSLLQALRLVYYIGVPFAALVLGRDAVTARFAGLQPVTLPGSANGVGAAGNWDDWVRDIGWALGLGTGLWLLMTVAWRSHRRALAASGEPLAPVRSGPSGWVLLREALYHEVHWGFYRNAPLLALGEYWGVWIGLLIVGIEALLNPAWRTQLGSAAHDPLPWGRVALAMVSSLLFLQTGNLWVAIGLHFAVTLGLTVQARRRDLNGEPESGTAAP